MDAQSHARFAPTRWSLVRRARAGDAEGRAALAELCAAYWSPVYAFFRRDGMMADDARDLTQGLFAELLEREDLAGGDPEVGRFRSYLLACARHYRSNQQDRQRAQKRGGARTHLPIRIGVGPDRGTEDGVTGCEPAGGDTPEQAYLRAWVRESVNAALTALGEEEAAKGRGATFALLHGALEGEASLPYAELATRLGCTEAAVKVAVHRLRARFRKALLRQLAGTLEDSAEAEDELRQLFAALG